MHVQEPAGEEKRKVEEGTEGMPKPPSNSEELPKAPRVWQEMHCCRDRVQSSDLVLRVTGSHGEVLERTGIWPLDFATERFPVPQCGRWN